MATTPRKIPADPREAALRKALKALERKYDRISERWLRLGRGEGPLAAQMRIVGQQVDAAQKALDEYLARRPA